MQAKKGMMIQYTFSDLFKKGRSFFKATYKGAIHLFKLYKRNIHNMIDSLDNSEKNFLKINFAVSIWHWELNSTMTGTRYRTITGKKCGSISLL